MSNSSTEENYLGHLNQRGPIDIIAKDHRFYIDFKSTLLDDQDMPLEEKIWKIIADRYRHTLPDNLLVYVRADTKLPPGLVPAFYQYFTDSVIADHKIMDKRTTFETIKDIIFILSDGFNTGLYTVYGGHLTETYRPIYKENLYRLGNKFYRVSDAQGYTYIDTGAITQLFGEGNINLIFLGDDKGFSAFNKAFIDLTTGYNTIYDEACRAANVFTSIVQQLHEGSPLFSMMMKSILEAKRVKTMDRITNAFETHRRTGEPIDPALLKLIDAYTMESANGKR